MKRNSNFGSIILLFVIIVIMFTACTDRHENIQPIQVRIDSMEQQLRGSYRPGFGELMLNIQIHHAKLWFAGKEGNWELADYNESLIQSAFRKIRTYHPDDPNTAATSMIDIPMDSIAVAISHKDVLAFRRSFDLLTTTCNNCHMVTKHAFNIITIPRAEPIGNQFFSLKITQNH